MSDPLDELLYIARNTEEADLTRRDLLECLIEECAEIIQAATKCLRFGYDRNWPGYGRNDQILAKEYGQLLAIGDQLYLHQPNEFNEGYEEKIKKIAYWKKYMQDHPVENK